MKKILFGIVLLVIACAFNSNAQTYASQSVVSYIGTSTNCAGSGATNIAKVMDVRKQANVTVSFKSRNDAAGTANVGALITYSVNGTDYDAVKGKLVTWPAVGTSDAICTTNLSTLGCGYMKIDWVTNAAAATVNTTNLVIDYGVKISAP